MKLEKIIAQETKLAKDLKKKHGAVYSLIPEIRKEYNTLKKTYTSIGQDLVNQFRVLMGMISNPSIESIDKELYIITTGKMLTNLELSGFNVDYLKKSYEMVMEYSNTNEVQKMDKLEHTLYHEISDHVLKVEAANKVPIKDLIDIYSDLSKEYRGTKTIKEYSRIDELKYMKQHFEGKIDLYLAKK